MNRFKEKYNTLKTWQDRALVMTLYHHLMIMKVKKWNERLTAKYFQISLGAVSTNLKLSKRMSEVRDCSTRKEALEKIK